MKRFAIAFVCMACCFAMMFSLVGCGQKNAEADAAAANRAYMSQLNTSMDDLNTKLGKFNEAVAQNDMITMRTVAKKVLADVEAIEAIEAPKDLKDLAAKYTEGLDGLGGALTAYVEIVADVEAGKTAGIQQRIDAAQKAYNTGIAALQEADAAAAKL